MTWEVGVAILIATGVYVLYKGSVELAEEHWPLKLGLFYGSLAMGWAAVNVALRFTIENTTSNALKDAVDTAYTAFLYISLMAFGYMMIRFFIWIFPKLWPFSNIGGDERGW